MAIRGPQPKPGARRRNAPTIPTTVLPATGRAGAAPKVPAPAVLGKPGRSWWRWAWSTPQAAAWDAGAHQLIARRASLEDDLATIADVEAIPVLDILEAEDARRVNDLIRRLAALATGKLAIFKECRELDDRLGLTPKAIVQMRWTVGEIEAEEEAAERPATVTRLRAVDPGAVAGA